MNQILEQLGTYGIVPVVVLQDAAKAEPLAEALCKGGLACAEVTFRTDAAEESIRIMSEKFPEMLVGAGTVLTTEQADRAVKAGAKFIVSPGLKPIGKYRTEFIHGRKSGRNQIIEYPLESYSDSHCLTADSIRKYLCNQHPADTSF